jgi:lysophospholipase-2
MGSSSHPPLYIHHPVDQHENTLIVLHGTSSTGCGFAGQLLTYPFSFPSPVIGSTSSIKSTLPSLFPTTRFVFPTGTSKPLTVLGGGNYHAWFNIHDFSDRTIGEEDQIRDMRESAPYLGALVADEGVLLKGKGKGKVAVLGFSSGCAMGVVLVLAGLLGEGTAFVGLSGWLPFRIQIEEEILQDRSTRDYLCKLLQLPVSPTTTTMNELRVWLGHGRLDTKMKAEWGKQMRDVLVRIKGLEVDELQVYEDLSHWFNEREMGDIVSFLSTFWGVEPIVREGEEGRVMEGNASMGT